MNNANINKKISLIVNDLIKGIISKEESIKQIEDYIASVKKKAFEHGSKRKI